MADVLPSKTTPGDPLPHHGCDKNCLSHVQPDLRFRDSLLWCYPGIQEVLPYEVFAELERKLRSLMFSGQKIMESGGTAEDKKKAVDRAVEDAFAFMCRDKSYCAHHLGRLYHEERERHYTSAVVGPDGRLWSGKEYYVNRFVPHPDPKKRGACGLDCDVEPLSQGDCQHSEAACHMIWYYDPVKKKRKRMKPDVLLIKRDSASPNADRVTDILLLDWVTEGSIGHSQKTHEYKLALWGAFGVEPRVFPDVDLSNLAKQGW